MSFPTTSEQMSDRCKALSNPIAVQILGALYGADQNGQPQFHQGGVTFCKEKLGLESGKTSYLLTQLAEAGVIFDATPNKARFKEYSIDKDDPFNVVLAQWASYVSRNAQPQAAAAGG